MRSVSSLYLAAAIATASLGIAAAEEPKADQKLVGTWKLVSAKYDGKEQDVTSTTTLKHITPEQMMWLSYDKNGRVIRGAGGSYTLKGDDFADTPEYGIGRDFGVVKGKTHKFKCKVEGKKWYHTGKLDSGLDIEEVWERLEKK
jgi:hypothetical protein